MSPEEKIAELEQRVAYLLDALDGAWGDVAALAAIRDALWVQVDQEKRVAASARQEGERLRAQWDEMHGLVKAYQELLQMKRISDADWEKLKIIDKRARAALAGETEGTTK